MRKENVFVIGLYGLSVLFLMLMSSCSSQQQVGTKVHYTTMDLEPVSDEGVEYDIIITDAGYESFLVTQKPMEFYSQNYYENWNRYYVNDWNMKVRSNLYRSAKYQDVFDMVINYEANINYGLAVNYKLYNYFLFVQKRYGVKFDIPRAINW